MLGSVVSIKDIARECGVHPTTVSRALSGSHEVSEATRARILRVCEERGYRPNLLARGLILNRTNMIGLLIPDIANPYYAAVIKGITSELDDLGYGLMLCNTDRQSGHEMKYINLLIQTKVDGVLILPTHATVGTYQPLVERGVPFVFIDNYAPGVKASRVVSDNYSGALELVDHMIRQGYRRIGIILGRSHSTASNERFRGYRDALAQHDIAFDEALVTDTNATFEEAITATGVLHGHGADSIFAINDVMAMGAMKYCSQHGIDVPSQLGIAGYDNIEQSAMMRVPLTTVHQEMALIGRTAAELLVGHIGTPDAPVRHLVISPRLVVRSSCGEDGATSVGRGKNSPT